MPLSAAWRNAKASIADKDCGKEAIGNHEAVSFAARNDSGAKRANPAKLSKLSSCKKRHPSNGNGWPSSLTR